MEYKWNVDFKCQNNYKNFIRETIIGDAHLLINKNHFSNFYIYLIQNHY